MKLSDDLLKKLNQKHEPSTLITMRYRNNDLAFKTDAEGNAVVLFIGSATEKGTIKGDRYTRVLVQDKDGILIKDHWERKGKAT